MGKQNKKRKSFYLDLEDEEIFFNFILNTVVRLNAQISLDRVNLNEPGWLIFEDELKSSIAEKTKLKNVLTKIISK